MHSSDILKEFIEYKESVKDSKTTQILIDLFALYLCGNPNFKYNSSYFIDSVPHFMKFMKNFTLIHDICYALQDKFKEEEAFYRRIKSVLPKVELPKIAFYFDGIFAYLPGNDIGDGYQFTILDENSEVRIDMLSDKKLILKCKAIGNDYVIERSYKIALEEKEILEKMKSFLQLLRKKK